MKIREYKKSDFKEIRKWALLAEGIAIEEDQLSPTTFISEIDGAPAAVISILLTNSKRYCIPECLLANPDLSKSQIKEAVEGLSEYVSHFARALEYRGLFCLAPNEVLMRRYRRLGFTPTLTGVTTMIKPL